MYLVIDIGGTYTITLPLSFSGGFGKIRVHKI
jgi:hypothetical protein